MTDEDIKFLEEWLAERGWSIGLPIIDPNDELKGFIIGDEEHIEYLSNNLPDEIFEDGGDGGVMH